MGGHNCIYILMTSNGIPNKARLFGNHFHIIIDNFQRLWFLPIYVCMCILVHKWRRSVACVPHGIIKPQKFERAAAVAALEVKNFPEKKQQQKWKCKKFKKFYKIFRNLTCVVVVEINLLAFYSGWIL